MAKYKPYLTKSEIALIEKLKKIRLENKIRPNVNNKS